MALIKCYECNHSISDQAMTCKNCGAKTFSAMEVEAAETPSIILMILSWLSVLYAFIYCMMNLFEMFPTWSHAFFQYYFEIYNFKIYPWYWLPIPSFLLMHMLYPKQHGEWTGCFIILSWVGIYFLSPTMI